MRKDTTTKRHSRGIFKRCVTAMLALALVMQSLVFGIATSAYEIGNILNGSSANANSSASGGVTNFDSEAIKEALQGDIIKTIKKDLLQRIEDYDLKGSVEIVLTFSSDSLLGEYEEKYADKMTYEEFKSSDAAAALEAEMAEGRAKALSELEEKGLIFEVKHTYSHLLDGAFVETTYENLSDICDVDGISYVMLSNSYLPLEATTNPVDVYETGIFNSGSVDYTGKGTIVAVLDTGCDYAHSAFTSYDVKDPKYDRDDIAELLSLTEAMKTSPDLEAREVYYGNLTGGKIAFGYDYADKDPDIMPFENSHGTHVAGIIAGKDTDEKIASKEGIKGVAIDAQLAIMKVFSDYDDGAKDGDIIAALEDCIILGVDAINMSLGTSCGFSYESDTDELYKNVIYGNIEKAGISLIVAASNDHSSGYGGENGNTNKTDNPDSATVGAPSSYTASFTVASISGKKDNYMLANGKDEIFFIKSFSTSAKEYDFFAMMGIKEGEKKVYEYVTVPGFGDRVNYAGIDVTGKIALVSRGDGITFEEKVQFAQEAGAIAVIIYNNVYGDITMTIGNHAKIPAVSIGKDDGKMLASVPTGTIEFDLSNEAGPFMSDFSSWGPTPDLKLKPEITAHGGNINSAVVGGEYDEMSGTSMAAPNMCGITVLIRQYVNEKYPDISVAEARDLVNRLCMSTATIANDKKGNPYSPRKQGAGIADIRKATQTEAYILVDGIGKTKLELGDDPKRTGVYEMEIKVVNMSLTNAQSYRLDNITMTESVSTSDPEYVAEIAYILDRSTEYTVIEGGTVDGDVLTVPAASTAHIKIKITLSDEAKAYIDSTFENGMYVEGYLTFDNMNEDGVDLNAPFLAFYGNWGDAPIFDLDYYEVETEAHDNAIDDDDKIKADYFATTPLGTYYYDYIIPLGTYVYEMDEDAYSAIPATREHAAISCVQTSISGIYGVFTGLLRGAKELNVSIVNTDTGEVVWSMTEYNCAKAHYSGAARGYMSKFDLPMYDTETETLFASNNAHFEVTMSAKLDWDGGENKSDTYSFSFYVDYEAPTVLDSSFRTEYDKSLEENRYYLDVTVYDNHYAMSCRPVLIYDFTDEYDDVTTTFSSLSEYPIPIYQQNKGEATEFTIEITDYIDIIKNSETPNGITLYVDDYAMNGSVHYIPFPETDDKDINFDTEELELDINQTYDLTTLLVDAEGAPLEVTDYLHTLQWSSTDSSVVAIKDGKIEALKSGEATVKVTSDTWLNYKYSGKDADGRLQYNTTNIYKTIKIKVSDNVMEDDPNSGKNAEIEDLFFTSYDTLFAFNTQIDFSEIGRTESTNYFDGKYSVAFYPSEKIKLNYELQPWNLASDRYELMWSSTNEKVATVDENGVVTAQAEGKARIVLQIKIDGKTSILAARLSVEVKSEFIIENRELVAYKGWGGKVEIPDDEGILYIGSYAFSHFYLDNKKEVEKDENGYYDLDDKKTPLGNSTVVSVKIPEGVESIKKYAFYNCSALVEVELPDSCETIGTAAFQKCVNLEKVNFAGDPAVENDKDGVKIVSDYAFDGCKKLASSGTNGADFAGIYAIGENAFRNTAFTEAQLTRLSRISAGAFKNCKKLESVTLGERTRISASMFEGCSALGSVTVYSDTIGDKAFASCTSLQSVVLKGNITYLGSEAFKYCTKLNSVEVNGALELIGKKAFYNCSGLTSFELPNGGIAIGDNAFELCSNLNSIVLQEKTVIESFGSNVFKTTKDGLAIDVTASEKYVSENGVIYTSNKDTLLFVNPSDMTEFTVPKTVKYIAAGAFVSAQKLQTLKFADGSEIVSIGNGAFAANKSITTVTLPTGKDVEIGANAFNGATNLSSINLSRVTKIGDYAFKGTAIAEALITKNEVEIGANAFESTASLKNVTLGHDAVIGTRAFYKSAVAKVELNGDAMIGFEAFRDCTMLTSFDFEEITDDELVTDGDTVSNYSIGDYAFYGCVRLTAVKAPGIKVIGKGSFANCTSIASLQADELVIIKDGAFFDLALDLNNVNDGVNQLQVLDLPKVETIGNSAFAYSANLKAVNAPNLSKIGEMAFCMNLNLVNLTVSEKLTNIPNRAFFGCQSLNENSFKTVLAQVERVGTQAFALTNLPQDLVLENLVYLDNQAFAEFYDYHFIKTFTAPKLTYIGDEAFGGCSKMESINAPLVEHIGSSAFMQTALRAFEVSDALTSVGRNPFLLCEKFEGFYAYDEDENKIDDATLENVMIKDGALYVENARGYTLICYPSAKDSVEFIVADGTTRIEVYAASMNTHLEMLVLPSTLRTISDFAFFGCESIDTVTFKSYYAPTLESMMSVATNENEVISVDNVKNYPGFNDLYEYSYSFKFEGWTGRNLYNNNFKGGIGGANAPKMTAIIPDNSSGYTSLAYKAYFNVSEDTTSGVTAGKYAIAFMEAVYRLPDSVDRFDKLLVEEAINAYNALDAHKDEKAFVDAASVMKFERLRSEYNADVANGKIANLFGMYNTEYHFNLLKDAIASYNALSDEERAMIESADVLEVKKAELSAAMGTDVDFNISYSDHFLNVTPPSDDEEDSGFPWLAIILIASSAAVAAGIGVAVYFLLKKKSAKKPVIEEENISEPIVVSDNGDADAKDETVDEKIEASVEETVEETVNEPIDDSVSDGEMDSETENSDAKED